jgi:hypothetical protein
MDRLCVKSGLGMSVFKIEYIFIYDAIIRHGFTEWKKKIFFHYKACKIHIYKVLRLMFRTYLYFRLLQPLFLPTPSHEPKTLNDVICDAEDRL